MKQGQFAIGMAILAMGLVVSAADIRVMVEDKTGEPSVVCDGTSYPIKLLNQVYLSLSGGDALSYLPLSSQSEVTEGQGVSIVTDYGLKDAETSEVRITRTFTLVSDRVFTLRTEVLNLGKATLLSTRRLSFPFLQFFNPPVAERKGIYRFGLEDYYGLKFPFGAGYYTRFVWETLCYTLTSSEEFYVAPHYNKTQNMTQVAAFGYTLRFDPGVPYVSTIQVEVGGGSKEQPDFAEQTRLQIVERMRVVAERLPKVLHWPDRRPLLMWNPSADLKLDYTVNPRGYRPHPELQSDGLRPDVTTPEGMVAFRATMCATASNIVERCRQANAQGAILWDFEGQEDPHAITYLGSPDRVLLHAPEMDAVADDMFAVLYDAGLRVGLTLRPQEVKIREARDPDWPLSWKRAKAKYYQDGNLNTAIFGRDGILDEDLMVQHLSRKAGYAYRRWKVTVFYIDSPAMISPYVMNELAKAYPDCLFIPEFPVTGYYGAAAPLHLWPNPTGGVMLAREVWPDAFGCSFGTHFYADNPEIAAQFTQWVKDGHLPVFQGYPVRIRPIIDEYGVPEHHDPAHFKWNENQPIGRALQARWLELYGAGK